MRPLPIIVLTCLWSATAAATAALPDSVTWHTRAQALLVNRSSLADEQQSLRTRGHALLVECSTIDALKREPGFTPTPRFLERVAEYNASLSKWQAEHARLAARGRSLDSEERVLIAEFKPSGANTPKDEALQKLQAQIEKRFEPWEDVLEAGRPKRPPPKTGLKDFEEAVFGPPNAETPSPKK